MSSEDLPDKLKHLEIVANNLMMPKKKTDTSEASNQEFDLIQNPFYATQELTSQSQVRFSNGSHCRKCRIRRRSEGESAEVSETSLRGDIPGVQKSTFKKNSKAILRDPVLGRKSYPSESSCRRHMPANSGALIDSFRKLIAHKQSTSSPGNDAILDAETCFEQSKTLKQQQKQIEGFTAKQAELRNSTSNIFEADDTTIPLNCTSITSATQIPPEPNAATSPRCSTSCAQQATGGNAGGGGGGTCDDVTIDELASYFDTLVHIPKKMSSMAEMMYT